ncbi:MAG: type II toxin-antitoxin system RelE/ParE family toxin [Verrucomicrobia bacterium]|nr:type II toxin-antitoxin system RelE/ParE family toxin [Verrucomicrobiota bacterium]
MDFKVLIAESAIADLKEIVGFVAQDDATAAIRLGNKLVDRALTLRTFPERFPFHDESRSLRKMPLAPFLVFYTCDDAAHVVNVIHFWHGARQSPQF